MYPFRRDMQSLLKTFMLHECLVVLVVNDHNYLPIVSVTLIFFSRYNNVSLQEKKNILTYS